MKVREIFVSYLVLTGFSGPRCFATVYHSDGSAANVQALHNAALDGDTITLPAGTFTWSTTVTITKAIKLEGTGSGRIIAESSSTLTVGTGARTLTIQGGLNIIAGQTLRIAQLGDRANFMEGAV